MDAAIWWVRRDLRLTDNRPLAAALESAGQVIPVFILDRRLLASGFAGEKRLSFLSSGLRALDNDLRARGSRLILRSGDPVQVLAALSREVGAGAVFAEEDFSPFAVGRDRAAGQVLPLVLLPGLTVHPPREVLKADRTPYTTFTPFNKAWQARPWPGDPLPAPRHIPTPPALESEPVPSARDGPSSSFFPAGEAEARRRLEAFTTGPGAPVYAYADNRDRLDLPGTSQLSPYLRFGMLSSRQAFAAAIQAIDRAWDHRSRRGAETWLNELVWREFFISVLYHFPEVRSRAFRPELDGVPWLDDAVGFAAWSEGRTGYPAIDAAMRQLAQLGWVHNRARMIAASFLAKDLLIDWRQGERHFMQHLVDGDPAANNGGWQWVAGTGADAAPYFRIFNPVLQGKKSDPEGAYVRRFLPELERVPDAYVHEPWKMSAALQRETGCVIGVDYPTPLIDHALARQRALIRHRQVRSAKGQAP